jgi:hypothetical protein
VRFEVWSVGFRVKVYSLGFRVWGLSLYRLGFRVYGVRKGHSSHKKRDRYFIAEQPAPAPHLARPERRAAIRIVLVLTRRESLAGRRWVGLSVQLYSKRDKNVTANAACNHVCALTEAVVDHQPLEVNHTQTVNAGY